MASGYMTAQAFKLMRNDLEGLDLIAGEDTGSTGHSRSRCRENVLCACGRLLAAVQNSC
jgi:hypothetical protein